MALGLQDIVLTHEMCYFGVTAKCPRCSSGSSSSIVQIQNLHLAPSQLAAVPCQPSRNPDLYIHDFVFSQRPKWNVHEFLDLLSATLASLLLSCNLQLLRSPEPCALFLYPARTGPSLHFVAVWEMFPRESWEEYGVYWCFLIQGL